MNKKSKGLVIVFLIVILITIICFSVFKKEKTVVVFNSLGGTVVESEIIEKGTPIKQLFIPTKEGYKFLAWVDKNGKEIYEGIVFDSEKVVLYAKWEKEAESIIPNIKEDDDIIETEQEKGEPDKVPVKEPVKEYYCSKGYTLKGTKCTKTITKSATLVTVCPEGYSDWGKNMCFDESSKVSPDYMVCPEGTIRDGDSERCYTSPMEYNKAECDAKGMHWYLGVCYSYWESVSCKNGEDFTITGDAFYCGGDIKIGKSKYTCPKGYTRNGSKCYKTETKNASIRYK